MNPNTVAVLADVSGFSPSTKRWIPFRLLGSILPSIDLSNGPNGVPLEYQGPNAFDKSGYPYFLFERIVLNLGRPFREGKFNEHQQNRVLNLAEQNRQEWIRLLS